MKKLLILLLVLGLAGIASATPPPDVYCGFNSTGYTLGALNGQSSAADRGWNGNWAASDPLVSVVSGGSSISEIPDSDPDQHVQHFCNNSTKNWQRAVTPWSDDNDWTLQMDVKVTTSGSGATNDIWQIEGLEVELRDVSNNRGLHFKFRWNGTIQLNDVDTGDPGGHWDPGPGYKGTDSQDWTTFKVEYIAATTTYEMWWMKDDGTFGMIATQNRHDNAAFDGSYEEMKINGPKARVDSVDEGVEWDNIRITPEPATIMLLCLGGLALIRKRR